MRKFISAREILGSNMNNIDMLPSSKNPTRNLQGDNNE
jgi:hypothetical protein